MEVIKIKRLNLGRRILKKILDGLKFTWLVIYLHWIVMVVFAVQLFIVLKFMETGDWMYVGLGIIIMLFGNMAYGKYGR